MSGSNLWLYISIWQICLLIWLNYNTKLKNVLILSILTSNQQK